MIRLLIIVVVFILMIILVIKNGIKLLQNAGKKKKYTQTTAVVERIVPDSRKKCRVIFKFTANDETEHLGDFSIAPSRAPELNSSVQVYYDPAYPGRNFSDKELSLIKTDFISALIAVVVWGILFAYIIISAAPKEVDALDNNDITTSYKLTMEVVPVKDLLEQRNTHLGGSIISPKKIF